MHINIAQVLHTLKFRLSIISTHRAEFMGLAIIWIMMYHFGFTQSHTLGIITQFGFSGVEIFMFVSGFGLYFSLNKDSNLLTFYLKRFVRIFPTYYLIGIIDSVYIYHDNITEYLFRYTTIGYWTGGIIGDWYIPSIVILYALCPLFKWLLDQRVLFLYCIIAVFLFLSWFWAINDNIIDRSHYFFVYRIPAFLFGMICAQRFLQEKSDSFFFVTLIIGIPCFVILFSEYKMTYNFLFFSFLFLLPTSLVLCGYISRCSYIESPLSRIGQSSLEIYLIQGVFYHAILYKVIIIPKQWHDFSTIIFIIISSLFGIMVHKLISITIQKIKFK